MLSVQAKQRGEPVPDEAQAKDEIENAILRKKVRHVTLSQARPADVRASAGKLHTTCMQLPRPPHARLATRLSCHPLTHPHKQVFDMLAEHASITWVDAPVPANAT